MDELRTTRRPRVPLGVVITLALLGACGQNSDDARAPSTTSSPPPVSATIPEAVQELDINGTEYAFEISPNTAGGLKPGWTRVRFHNDGAEAHQVMFAHIKEGVDLSDLAEAGANDSSGAGAIEFVDMIGGVSYIGAGHETTAMVELTEGLVMAMCYVPDAQGVAHALMGMTAPLTVTPPTEGPSSPSDEPADDQVVGTIELSADGYRVPEDLGTGWYHVTNTDSSLHELSLLRLGEPVDDEQAADLVGRLAANEPPTVEIEAVGGMGAVSPGFDGYLYLDLDPGSYLAVDFMPDPGDPRPHMLDGYYTRFTV